MNINREFFSKIRFLISTGCSCGHNKLESYIGVDWEDIGKMKELGYEIAFNLTRPGDEDSFKPRGLWWMTEKVVEI